MHFPWNQKFKVKLYTFDRKKSKSKFTPRPREIKILARFYKKSQETCEQVKYRGPNLRVT